MNEQIKNIKINLLRLLKRMEQVICDDLDTENEIQIQSMNDKVYELADVLETIEVLLE